MDECCGQQAKRLQQHTHTHTCYTHFRCTLSENVTDERLFLTVALCDETFDPFPPFDVTTYSIRHAELCNIVISQIQIQRNPPKLF